MFEGSHHLKLPVDSGPIKVHTDYFDIKNNSKPEGFQVVTAQMLGSTKSLA